MDKSIESRARFDFIRYANCWEDADILCEALKPGPGKRFLSIASAGDNSLALLAEGAEVVACDLNPAQLACVELKCAAISKLPYDQVIQFFGICPSNSRTETYRSLRAGLTPQTRAFWDYHQDSITRGFIHNGKFERYFHIFRRAVLPLLAGQARIRELLTEKSIADQREFYEHTWDTWRWRLLFKVFFSRAVMGRAGRVPEFFRYVQGSVGSRILTRARFALTELPTHNNPYLRYILTGNFNETMPRFLTADRFEKVRANLNLLTLKLGAVQEAAREYPADSFDGFNLSDIFEYLSPELCSSIYVELLRKARKGARFAYWNMLVPRSRPEAHAGRILPLDDLSEQLFKRDKAFFYSAFRVEELQ